MAFSFCSRQFLFLIHACFSVLSLQCGSLSTVSMASCINASIFSLNFLLDHYGSHLSSVLSPDVLPQKSYSSLHMAGWMSHMHRFFLKSSTISCLSNPISGRYTGIVHTSLVAARDCIVWLATCPILSPVIRPRHLFFFRKMLCNFHHITAHDDRQFLMRTLFINIQAGYL